MNCSSVNSFGIFSRVFYRHVRRANPFCSQRQLWFTIAISDFTRIKRRRYVLFIALRVSGLYSTDWGRYTTLIMICGTFFVLTCESHPGKKGMWICDVSTIVNATRLSLIQPQRWRSHSHQSQTNRRRHIDCLKIYTLCREDTLRTDSNCATHRILISRFRFIFYTVELLFSLNLHFDVSLLFFLF